MNSPERSQSLLLFSRNVQLSIQHTVAQILTQARDQRVSRPLAESIAPSAVPKVTNALFAQK